MATVKDISGNSPIDYDVDTRNVATGEDRWPDLLDYSPSSTGNYFGLFINDVAATGGGSIKEDGEYDVEAPGTIPNAALHNCPEIGLTEINIIGAGSDRVILRSTPTGSGVDRRSSAILKAAATNGVLFSLSGVTLDGAIDGSTITLNTGAFPNSQSLLEVAGYDRVYMRDVVFTGSAQDWDDRSDPNSANYDALVEPLAFARRGCALIRGNDRVFARVILKAPTHREGLWFPEDNEERDIRVVYLGNPGVTPTFSSVLNACGAFYSEDAEEYFGATPRDIKTVIDLYCPNGGWNGSCLNLGWTGDAWVSGVVDGRVGTVNTRTSITSTDLNNNGPGIDVGAEINHRTSRSLHLDLRCRNNHRYSIAAQRDPTIAPIQRVTGSASVIGGWRGAYFAGVDSLYLDYRAEGQLRMPVPSSSSLHGAGLILDNIASGDVRVTLDGSASSTIAVNGEAPEAVESWIGVVGQGCEAKISGSIRGFKERWIRLDQRTDTVDGATTVRFGRLSLENGDYDQTDNPDVRRMQVGRGASLRAKTVLGLDEVTINGAAVLADLTQLGIFTTESLGGVASDRVGNTNTVLTTESLLYELAIVGGDGSGGQGGVRGRYYARPFDDLGRGLVHYFSAGDASNVDVDVLNIGPWGTRYSALAADPTGVNGGLFYSSASKAFRVYTPDPTDVAAWRSVATVTAGSCIIYHATGINQAQGADLGGISFWNGDGSQTTPGVKVRFGGIAGDANGRGGNAIIQTAHVNGSLATVATISGVGYLTLTGGLTFQPSTSVTPANNNEMAFELTSNTLLTIKVKGSDGTVRSATIVLA
jgi:hypothetical protein